jgi:hypothetical protein
MCAGSVATIVPVAATRATAKVWTPAALATNPFSAVRSPPTSSVSADLLRMRVAGFSSAAARARRALKIRVSTAPWVNPSRWATSR